MTRPDQATTRYRPRHAPHNFEQLMNHARAQDLHDIATILGISRRWARELRATGLTDAQADRYACRIGHHPSQIWPDWWDIDPDIEEGPDGIMRWATAS